MSIYDVHGVLYTYFGQFFQVGILPNNLSDLKKCLEMLSEAFMFTLTISDAPSSKIDLELQVVGA